MKIIQGKYPQVADDTWIKQADGTKPIENKVFYERLTAYFKNYNVKVTGYGYRSIANQAKLYLAWKQDPTRNNRAAYPGTSWHNCALAYDVNRQGTDPDGTGHWPATMEADYLLPPVQQTLAKWGLCLPLWKGSNSPEAWHIQPIETIGQQYKPQWFADEDDLLNNTSGYRTLDTVVITGWTDPPVYMEGKDVQRAMRAFGITEYGVYDDACKNAAKAFQTKYSISPVSGTCATLTWAKINSLLGPAGSGDCQTQIDELNKQIDALEAQIVTLNQKLADANIKIVFLTKQLSDTQVQVTALNAQIVSLNNELSSTKTALIAMTADRNTKLKELTDLAAAQDTTNSILAKY